MPEKIYLETLGCAKNRVDSEIMLGILTANSFLHTERPEDADVIIVNTCAFLTASVSESVERIIELGKNKAPETGRCRSLVVAGCMSERYREKILDELPEADAIIGTSDYTQILPCVRSALEEKERRSYLSDKPRYSMNNSGADRIMTTGRHYTYLKISEGCSNNCSFCNIPLLRGTFSSRPIKHVVHEFKAMIANGAREINIISQDSSSYGADLNKEQNLLNLVRALLDSTDEFFWLRIFYSYPNTYPRELFKIMSEDPRLVPYIDMPFQHASDKVLKDMSRRVTRSKIERLIDEALTLVPDLAIRTTMIVGFPTETDEDFGELEDFVEKGYLSHMGVFEYSHEDNIRSAKFGDPVPAAVKSSRKKKLMKIQQGISMKRNLRYVGTKMQVLVSGVSSESDLLLEGRTKYQAVDVDGVVLINEGIAKAGDFTEVEISEAHPYDLIAGVTESH